MRTLLAMTSGAALLLLAALPATGPDATAPPQDGKGQDGKEKSGKQKADAAEEFFDKGVIPRLEIELDDEALASLRSTPREYAKCKVRENGKTVYDGVGIKLKGAAGSFREFDDWKPGFTLNTQKFGGKERFHGLKKFHLNNALQDDSYLHEWIGSAVFRAAHLAATRVTHARVTVAGRDLGVYVLKEGFDKRFVERWFPVADAAGTPGGDAGDGPGGQAGQGGQDDDEEDVGSLYDGGFCQDIDVDLEKDVGRKKDEHGDLHQLLFACQEPAVLKRWQLIPQKLDVDEFATFMALELMLGHWDGYCVNKNNYRLYFEPRGGKAHFVPHGMDQILNDPEASVLDHPGAIVAAAVMRNPEWRALYRRKIGELLPLFNAKKLEKQIDEVHDRLLPVLMAWDKQAGRAFDERVKSLGQQLEAREKSLKEQKGAPEPKPLVFTEDKPVKLDKWRAASECEDAQLEERKVDSQPCLVIRCGRSKVCIASWRRSVLLPRGKYRLQAIVKLDDVVPLDEGEGAPGKGCGLRIAGRERTDPRTGTSGFRACDFEFTVDDEMADVELIAELRSARGQAAFRADAFKLTRTE